MDGISQNKVDLYHQAGMGSCPYCASGDTYDGGLFVKNVEGSQRWECYECKNGWTVLYSPIGIVERDGRRIYFSATNNEGVSAGATISIPAEAMALELKKFIDDADMDVLAAISGHMFGGKCVTDGASYTFTANSNYCNALDAYKKGE